VFAACQPGAERALKNDVARRYPDWRAAFARPGFVTFKLSGATADRVRVDSVFARTWGVSLGRIAAATEAELARAAWERLDETLGTALATYEHLHVWQRDALLPGDEGFEPAAQAPVAAAAAALLAARPKQAVTRFVVNEVAGTGERVIDCVLVAPGEWWLGRHVAIAGAMALRWPGGVPPLAAPAHMISRAYLKIQEALLWSELPVAAGDRCVEIGSAPGGSCLALLERGCFVTGIDPAEMDPAVVGHPRFTHVRARAKDAKRSVFRDCRWLLMDANVAPNYTLDALNAIVTRPNVRPEGLLLTLKLTDPALATKLLDLAERIRKLGYKTVRMRQLAFNRQEICAVATDPVAPSDSSRRRLV